MKLLNSDCSLVMLHGFLGNHHDFDEIISLLPENLRSRTIAIDLPGHNNNEPANFRESIHYIDQHIQNNNINNFVLYGYSLGGRLATNYAFNARNSHLKGLILESSSFGITDEERKMREGTDLMWASQFALKKPEEILTNWYNQPIFDGLTDLQKRQLINLRRNQDFHKLAIQFDATSVAHQENYRNRLNELSIQVNYIYGGKDQKYTLAAQRENNYKNFTSYCVAEAGHNIHTFFPQRIVNIITKCEI